MTEDDLRELVLRTLTDIAPEIEPEDIEPSEDLREQVDLDSMDFLNFVIALHEATDIDIPEVDYPHLATLTGCVEYLDRKLVAARTPGT